MCVPSISCFDVLYVKVCFFFHFPANIRSMCSAWKRIAAPGGLGLASAANTGSCELSGV